MQVVDVIEENAGQGKMKTNETTALSGRNGYIRKKEQLYFSNLFSQN